MSDYPEWERRKWTPGAGGMDIIMPAKKYSDRYPVWIESGSGSAGVFTREMGIQIAHEILKRCGEAPPASSGGTNGRSAFG